MSTKQTKQPIVSKWSKRINREQIVQKAWIHCSSLFQSLAKPQTKILEWLSFCFSSGFMFCYVHVLLLKVMASFVKVKKSPASGSKVAVKIVIFWYAVLFVNCGTLFHFNICNYFFWTEQEILLRCSVHVVHHLHTQILGSGHHCYGCRSLAALFWNVFEVLQVWCPSCVSQPDISHNMQLHMLLLCWDWEILIFSPTIDHSSIYLPL